MESHYQQFVVTPFGTFVETRGGGWRKVIAVEGTASDPVMVLSNHVTFRVAAPQVDD